MEGEGRVSDGKAGINSDARKVDDGAVGYGDDGEEWTETDGDFGIDEDV